MSNVEVVTQESPRVTDRGVSFVEVVKVYLDFLLNRAFASPGFGLSVHYHTLAQSPFRLDVKDVLIKAVWANFLAQLQHYRTEPDWIQLECDGREIFVSCEVQSDSVCLGDPVTRRSSGQVIGLDAKLMIATYFDRLLASYFQTALKNPLMLTSEPAHIAGVDLHHQTIVESEFWRLLCDHAVTTWSTDGHVGVIQYMINDRSHQLRLQFFRNDEDKITGICFSLK